MPAVGTLTACKSVLAKTSDDLIGETMNGSLPLTGGRTALAAANR